MDQIGEEHFPWTGKDKVEESRARATGLYGETMDLFIGKYTMGIYERDVLIKKGVQLKRETFELLSEFFHPNAVHILDFIDEDKNRVSFVVSKVDASFLAWLKAEGKQKQLMFDENGKMKTLFRDMIIELCDLVDSLLGKGIVIANSFNMEDFYLTISDDGIPKLVLLLTAVKKPQYPKHDVKESWKSVRNFINSCCTECDTKLNSWGKNFSDFIGKDTFTLEMLRGYPDTWDYKMKGDYLLSLHVADQKMMRSLIKGTCVHWPKSDHVLPELLNGLIESSEKKGYFYNDRDPYEYTALLKNSYKHFDELPEHFKSILVNREGLLKQIERWSPDIWKNLYEIIVFLLMRHFRMKLD
ncbi:hypothetical protein QYE76_016127 [Lolium multiflorum]|uniref:Uncharacterized protein n=1 Tax=Lolium multiflorum TaxID=4521 RepID=A0AAD8U3P8_LOLMU|nr:hypothetical protein QYE76_016127 [Lolium multiflorum]